MVVFMLFMVVVVGIECRVWFGLIWNGVSLRDLGCLWPWQFSWLSLDYRCVLTSFVLVIYKGQFTCWGNLWFDIVILKPFVTTFLFLGGYGDCGGMPQGICREVIGQFKGIGSLLQLCESHVSGLEEVPLSRVILLAIDCAILIYTHYTLFLQDCLTWFLFFMRVSWIYIVDEDNLIIPLPYPEG